MVQPVAWPGRLSLLHHNPEVAANAEGVRGFLGETWVHPISVMLHTSGALLIAGALLAVILMTHRARHAADPGSAIALRGRALPWARGLLVAGWALNLLGGSMRLFEPDHPTLAEIDTVTWVQVLLVKHIAILVALLASLVAVEWAPRLWHRFSPQAASLGIILVFVSAILGGVSTGLPVPADEMFMQPSSAGVPSAPPGELVVDYRNTSYQNVMGTPLEPFQQEFPFEVDHWAFNMSARVEWTMEQSEFSAHLLDPNEDAVQVLQPGPSWLEGRVNVNLYPGTWILVVESEQALRETVDVSIEIDKGTSGTRILEDTVTVGRDDFLELNFWMDPDDEFHYEWLVPDAHGPVYWDIHTHPDDEVRYHERGEAFQADGHFTAGNEQIYSILWAPVEDRSFTISYRVEGDFRLHSIYD